MRKNRMYRITHPGRRGPARGGKLRTDYSEDYDTTNYARESEDNWDNEGGIFANPDEDFDVYDDDFEEGYDDDVEDEFDDDVYAEDDWEDDEDEYDGGYAEDDDDMDRREDRQRRRSREGTYGGNSSLRRKIIMQTPRRYGEKPSSASRVRHSGISAPTNRNKTRNKRPGSGLDNRRRYDW